jgi:hypothetical protein
MQRYSDFRLFTTILQFFDPSLCDKRHDSATVVFYPQKSVVWAQKKLPVGEAFLVYKSMWDLASNLIEDLICLFI